MADKASEKKDESEIDSPLLKVKKVKTDLRKKEPPLVDVKVTNPITYIKSWWKKIIGNEGIEIKVKVRPLTAIAISVILITVTFGIGYFKFPFKIPFFEYGVKEESFPPNTLFRETAFSGTLRYDRLGRKYYLLTETSEAINLLVPKDVDLKEFKDRRIFATGYYYSDTRTLKVESATDLELLPEKAETIPTSTSTSTPATTPEATITHVPTLTPVPTAEETPTNAPE
jgi:hypothetical protein